MWSFVVVISHEFCMCGELVMLIGKCPMPTFHLACCCWPTDASNDVLYSVIGAELRKCSWSSSAVVPELRAAIRQNLHRAREMLYAFLKQVQCILCSFCSVDSTAHDKSRMIIKEADHIIVLV